MGATTNYSTKNKDKNPPYGEKIPTDNKGKKADEIEEKKELIIGTTKAWGEITRPIYQIGDDG